MGIAKDLLLNSIFVIMMFTLLILCSNTGTVVLVLLACFCMITNYAKKYYRARTELIKEREYFINTLSHDIRVSTIAQIRGLELLKNDNSQDELVAEIKESCKYTLDMITMLLNAYRYENGEQILHYEKFLMSDLVNSNCNDLKMFAKEKNVSFKLCCDMNDLVEADKLSISKLMFCLLTTALFNSEKNCEVKILVNRLYNCFEVSLTYQGVPLTDEESRRMFLEGSNFSTVGHGIRMHFCKKILDFHGGNLRVSNNGKINSFTFTLPAERHCNSSKMLVGSIS